MSFVLCVVFKCQYFWSYSRKTHFLPFIYILQKDVTQSKLFDWPDFFLQVHDIPIKFFFFVICVVLKCQYFWSYSIKSHFWPFMYIFQRAVTHSKIVRLTRFFFYRFRTFQLSFFVLWVLSLSKNHEAKMSKNWISWRPSWIFGGHLGLTMENF